MTYEMRRFEDDKLRDVFASNVVAVGKQEKTLFSHIDIDSNSGPERNFAQACEDNDDVLFCIKLPRWFQIETPVGPYNPDWALAYRNDRIYILSQKRRRQAAATMCSLTCCARLRNCELSAASDTSKILRKYSSRWLVR